MGALFVITIAMASLILFSLMVTFIKKGSLVLNKNVVFGSVVSIMLLLCFILFTGLPSNYVYHRTLCVVFMMFSVIGFYAFRKERKVRSMQLCLLLGVGSNILLYFI